MYGGGGGESIFVMLPLAMAVCYIFWGPFWLIAGVRWRLRAAAGKPVSKLLRAAVLWPIAPLMFSIIGGSLSVVYGNGPMRQADNLTTEIVELQDVTALERGPYSVTSKRHYGCGTATDRFTGGSLSQPGVVNDLWAADTKAQLQDLGWSSFVVTPPKETDDYTRLNATRDNARVQITIGPSGSGEVRVDACRDNRSANHLSTGEDQAKGIGLDLTFWSAVAAWAAGLVSSRWLWRWQQSRSRAERIALLIAVAIALIIIANLAIDTWIEN